MSKLVITRCLGGLPVAALLLASGLTLANESARPMETLTEFPVPPAAPELSLKDMEGVRHELGEYRGQVVLVHFWAVWCGPCRDEFPAMDRAMDTLAEHDVVILAINSGDSKEPIREFLAEHPVRFPVLKDADSEASGQWQVQGLPTTYVVSPDGTIHGGAVGAREWDTPALLEQVIALTDAE